MTDYVFTAELPGVCAKCDRKWRAGAGVLLTAQGVVHKDCAQGQPAVKPIRKRSLHTRPKPTPQHRKPFCPYCDGVTHAGRCAR